MDVESSKKSKPIVIPWPEDNIKRRRSMSYPTPPDEKDMNILKRFKLKLKL